MVVEYSRYRRWPKTWPARIPWYVRWPVSMPNEWSWPYSYRITLNFSTIPAFWEPSPLSVATWVSTTGITQIWEIEPSLIQNGTRSFLQATLLFIGSEEPAVRYQVSLVGENAGFWQVEGKTLNMRPSGFSGTPGQASGFVQTIRTTFGDPESMVGVWGFTPKGGCVIGEE